MSRLIENILTVVLNQHSILSWWIPDDACFQHFFKLNCAFIFLPFSECAVESNQHWVMSYRINPVLQLDNFQPAQIYFSCSLQWDLSRSCTETPMLLKNSSETCNSMALCTKLMSVVSYLKCKFECWKHSISSQDSLTFTQIFNFFAIHNCLLNDVGFCLTKNGSPFSNMIQSALSEA